MERNPDRLAASLAAGFIVLLLATEGALTLPGESDSASKVADFYTAHRVTIIVLQLLGFVASALLAAYSWRLRRVDLPVAWAGVLMALCSVVPGAITLVLAVVADTADTSTAGRLNDLEPRGDDALFVGILVFAFVVALSCVREDPEARPTMRNVAQELSARKLSVLDRPFAAIRVEDLTSWQG